MANPLSRVFGNLAGRRSVESIVPRRTFDDVVLPPSTRRALDQALAQVTSHDLIFNRWGLGERHPTGLALAFNFALLPWMMSPLDALVRNALSVIVRPSTLRMAP